MNIKYLMFLEQIFEALSSEYLEKRMDLDLKAVGKPESKKKKKESKKELKELRDSIKENEFNEYILKNLMVKKMMKSQKTIRNSLEAHSILDTRLNLLNITKKEDAELYKEYLIDNYKLK